MKILLIDNYDSFTYNLVHYASELGADVQVVRNDAMQAERIVFEKPDGIIISPGPGEPKDAGICLELIKKSAGKIPVFGVCLGHQAIGEAFGGKIVRTEPMHGKTSPIYHEGKGVFHNIPSPFTATRYHSLIIQELGLPDDLEVTARTKDGIIMGVRHTEYDIEGVQFHPESIASEFGHKLLENFLKRL